MRMADFPFLLIFVSRTKLIANRLFKGCFLPFSFKIFHFDKRAATMSSSYGPFSNSDAGMDNLVKSLALTASSRRPHLLGLLSRSLHARHSGKIAPGETPNRLPIQHPPGIVAIVSSSRSILPQGATSDPF